MDLIQTQVIKDMQMSFIFIHSSQWRKLQINMQYLYYNIINIIMYICNVI